MKKGMVESQFNWIFVFVIGAIILVFIVGYVNSQRGNAEVRIGQKTSKDLHTIITHASVSIGKSDIVKLPNTQIELLCDPQTCNTQGCASQFLIAGTNVGWDTPSQVIFSPDLIKGQSMLSWALGWNMPYHAVNFVYLTSPEVRYIFINDTNNKMNAIFEEIPESISKELLQHLDPIFDKNNYKVRMIYYNDGILPEKAEETPSLVPIHLREMPPGDVTAIMITPSSSTEEYGQITFYRNQLIDPNTFQQLNSVFYLGKPSLYGAIFSETKELFECNMKKAFAKLYMTSLVYTNVINTYKNAIIPDICNDHYDLTVVEQIKDAAESLNIQTSPIIYQSASQIKTNNQNLKIYSCPILY